MKTATLTFHSPNNNGSFFQAYALQKKLIELGIENEIIDFYSNEQERQYSIFRRPRSAADIARNAISLLHYNKIYRKNQKFDSMRKRYLIMSKRCTTVSEVQAIIPDYDAIICGSDQIWNTAARDFSEVYLLPNIKNPKITYAVSCGSNIEKIDSELVYKRASEFDAISFRENSTKEYFKEKGLENTTTLIDPTFFLSASDYNKMYADSDAIVEGNYIFLYTINYNSQALKLVKKISDITGMPVFTAFMGYSAIKCTKYGIKILYDISPDVFINLVRNASIVCSNSFHGLVFALIYHKEVYRLCDVDKQGRNVRDERLDSLLDFLNLDKINVNIYDQFTRETIDYKKVDETIEIAKKEAIHYLKASLGIV